MDPTRLPSTGRSPVGRYPRPARRRWPVRTIVATTVGVALLCFGGIALAAFGFHTGAAGFGSAPTARAGVAATRTSKPPHPASTHPAPAHQPTTGASFGVVPDVLCQDLRTAEDRLHHAGYLNLASRDGTGQGRKQLVYPNWLVIGQSVAPGGGHPLTTRIVLSVVKAGEPTGDSGCRS
jgi:hypothetical protein